MEQSGDGIDASLQNRFTNKENSIEIPYLILIGCWTGRSQSVYSFTIVAKISFKW